MNFFIKESTKYTIEKNGYIILDDCEIYHHLIDVLRKKSGDKNIHLIQSNKKIEYVLEISKIFNKEKIIEFKILEEKREEKAGNKLKQGKAKNIQITLVQALAKSDKLDYLLQKTTELGISKISLVQMDRSIVLLDKSNILNKEKRYLKILESASKQSRRVDIPQLKIFNNLYEIDFSKYDYVFFLFEKEDQASLKNVLLDISKKISEDSKLCFIVGPEGGFSRKEIEFLLNKDNIISITLGKRILRTETAGVAFLSILQYELGDM